MKLIPLLVEGQEDPYLKQKVQDLIFWAEDFVVYVDVDNDIQWYHEEQAVFPPGSRLVLAEVAQIKALSSHLQGSSHFRTLRCLLAQVVAQLYRAEDVTVARFALERAREYLVARSSQVAKRWAFYGAINMCVGTGVFVFLCWGMLKLDILDNDGWNIMRFGSLGAAGALLSLLSRSDSAIFDAGAGRNVYMLDGTLRILVGLLGGYLMVIALKAEAILGFAKGDASYLSFLLAFAAGISERLVPQFVSSLENQIRVNGSEPPSSPTVATKAAAEKAVAEKTAADKATADKAAADKAAADKAAEDKAAAEKAVADKAAAEKAAAEKKK